MASPDQVKQYLAYWFQLGKKLVVDNGRASFLPQSVLQDNGYSPEFEACWQHLLESGGRDCYLEGTTQTIEQLLSSEWEVTPCARCDMPVPMFSLGMRSPNCPCADLPFWPDTNMPQPRSPVSTYTQLNRIRDRLLSQNRAQSDSSSNRQANQ